MKTIVITGANSGIGYQSSLQLAKLNHKIIMICRDKNKAEKACNEIINNTKNKKISYFICDLSNIQSVKDTANAILKENENIDVLINNAADFDISNKKPRFNDLGIEKQFATNVIAPFILSELFVPTLSKTNGKIINISSQGLMMYPNLSLDFSNLNSEKKYNPAKTYYQNKLALLMMSLFMREKYPDIKFHAIRVTNVKIDISRYSNINVMLKFLYKIKSRFSISPSQMAKVYTELSINNYSGFLYDQNLKEVKANKFAYNKNAQQQLYDLLSNYL